MYNALGVCYVLDGKLEKGIAQFEKAVKLQPGYVTAWNNLGDAYEKKKDFDAALKAFEEVLLFDPNNPFFFSFVCIESCFVSRLSQRNPVHTYFDPF